MYTWGTHHYLLRACRLLLLLAYAFVLPGGALHSTQPSAVRHVAIAADQPMLGGVVPQDADEAHLRVAQAAAPTADQAADTGDAQLAQVTTRISTYGIRGTSSGDLAAQINALGPGEAGARYAANTNWLINWSYHYLAQDNHCSLTSASVHVQIEYVYPRWINMKQAAPAVVKRWQRFMDALETHERGHATLAAQAGHEVLQVLRALAAADSCAALSSQAESAAGQVLARHSAVQAAYDAATHHGQTQGAIW